MIDVVPAAGPEPHRVAVIMRTRNSAWVVHQALASLFAQEFRAFDLIVVDSGSRDATQALVAAYPHRLITVPDGRYQPGPVLNAAIAACTHPILVFWNSDGVALDPGVLGQLVAACETGAAAAFARQLPRPEARAAVRRDYAESFPPTDEPPPWITLSLVVSSMRRDAWATHPFTALTWASEDSQWGAEARVRGQRVQYLSTACVMHSHDYTLSQIYGRMFVEGEADAFIAPQPTPWLPRVLLRALLLACRDLPWCWRHRDAAGAALALLRRATAQWAWWRGHRLGTRRRRAGDTDPSLGQAIVLARHESQQRRS